LIFEYVTYDGQTGEEIIYSAHGVKNVPPPGTIKGRFDHVEWFEAGNAIDELMADKEQVNAH
jgi:hypothetical protein